MRTAATVWLHPCHAGIANDTVGSTANLHSPRFMLDEGVLHQGAALHTSLALEYLAQGGLGGGLDTSYSSSRHEEL